MAQEDRRTTKQLIEASAFRLFLKQGYDETSYTAIAEESGFSRPLVQRHFPKKDDLAVRFIRTCMLAIEEVLKQHASSWCTLDYTMRFGQVYYAFLLHSEGMRTFFHDILQDRNITLRINTVNNDLTVPALSGRYDEKEFRAGIRAVGGIYELVFWELEQGIYSAPSSLSAQNIALFLSMSEEAVYQERYDFLMTRALSDADQSIIVDSVCRKLDSELAR